MKNNNNKTHGVIETVIYFGFNPEKAKAGSTITLNFKNNSSPVVTYPDGSKEKCHTITNREAQGIKGVIKPRVVSSINNIAAIDPENYIFNNFNYICAVDTNTRQINSENISVSCFRLYRKINNNIYKEKDYLTTIFKNCQNGCEEKYAWMTFIKLIVNNKGNKNKKYAVLTDHDRGNHQCYNNRTKPIYDNFKIPKNITLFYASDRPKDSRLNNMVKDCDANAKIILDSLEKDSKLLIDKIPLFISDIDDLNRK